MSFITKMAVSLWTQVVPGLEPANVHVISQKHLRSTVLSRKNYANKATHVYQKQCFLQISLLYFTFLSLFILTTVLKTLGTYKLKKNKTNQNTKENKNLHDNVSIYSISEILFQ